MSSVSRILLFFCCVIFSFHTTVTAAFKIKADYIVVGVGTAGAVVAKRLSDNKKNHVIALHIGPNLTDDPLISLSANAVVTVPAALVGPPLYQSGDTIPQPNADDKELPWAVALPYGGASSINAGIYCRNTNQNAAQWEAIAGPLWSVNRILQIYKDLEKYRGTTTNPATRGFTGPLKVLQDPSPSQIAQKFTQAIINATGTPFVVDYNDPNTPIGASSQVQATHSGPDGVFRVSSINAFLNDQVVKPNGHGVHGRNLQVLFNATALRTLWKGNKAVGVEYLQNGLRQKIYAKKGIVVCAGLKSSFFLLHSGIGPRALLQQFGIPVIFDNPNVGQGLADQPAVRTLWTANPDDLPDNFNWLITPLAWLPAPGGNPIIRELRFACISVTPGLTVGTFDLCQPRSRGSVSINSPDPLADPVIDLGTFNDPADFNLFMIGFQTYIQNINTAIQAIDSDYEIILPDSTTIANPVLLADFIRENVDCNQHFQSHCRMAPFEQGGVVDSTGKVYGVNHLYVADDSIVPICMDGSPMASAYLIGANVAQIILDREKN